MTASLASAEKGKPPVLGRCLIATDDLPPRQPRRVSDFGSPDRAEPSPRLLPAVGAPGGHVVERVGSDVTAIFLHLGRRPAKNADQNIAEFFGSVAPSVFGFAHERNHEGSHDREVVNLCQGFGNVCRA